MYVHSSQTTTGEGGEVTCERAVGRKRIWWGSNNSERYDGKVEDVPVQLVTDGSLAVGGIATVNVGGGRAWAGRVIELFYQQNFLDLPLPIKRTGNQSLVSCTCCLQFSVALQPSHHLQLLIWLLTRNHAIL